MSKKELKPGQIRSINDDIHDQHKKMKDMTFKEKISYFWYYYKFHTIGTIIGVIAVISILTNILTAKDYSFYGILLNASDVSEETIENSFVEYAQLDSKKYDCFVDTNTTMSNREPSEYDLATAQRLFALVQTKDLDALITDSEIYNNYAYNEMFLDLRNVLTPEEISKYEKNFYYVDYAEIQKSNEDSTYEIPNILTSEQLKDFTLDDVYAEADIHRHPEDMKDPIPVGIFLTDSPFAVKSEAYSVFQPIFGFSVTSIRTDASIAFLNYLWDDSVEFADMHRDLYE